ncbi:glucoamylase family protein [Niabella beijingensis]|uniref:glucoamylase family protein n=1 Tax=Niabella beijingensis TaxID=2872700 RepID=UPI001CBC4CB8|nr:glucoamylase family protein [Niabella beijingensis]MBZ4189139.1 Ig-like domain-containing protein [Niabella beijingensis]
MLRVLILGTVFLFSCGSKKDTIAPPPASIKNPVLDRIVINGLRLNTPLLNTPVNPKITLYFSQPIKAATVNAITLNDANGVAAATSAVSVDGDSAITIQPTNNLAFLTRYTINVSTALQSASGGTLQQSVNSSFVTKLDSSRKFLPISDESLLTKVQHQTFNYFWDFAHPVSGMIREGSKHPADLVTSGGTGFGIMALITGIERGFITKNAGFQRMQKIVAFLKNTAQTYHGAYPHWLNGSTGVTIPFSTNDTGADLVETGFLVQGLICARQYFSGPGDEAVLRTAINAIIDNVEWSWFRQNDQPVLYWHWSPDNAWTMNLKIQGWNECLITYILAAGSKNYPVPKTVYDEGWTRNGEIKNGKSFYTYPLPLGPDFGGPLFFAHYSFMGLNPNGLSDAYANYFTQNKNHALINYSYCKANPQNYYGYSDSVWGLTASNTKDGYTASSPLNDQGVIAPTAALSSFPYTPKESMAALHFFYYVLGDKLWKEYGFVDAFSLDVLKNNGAWFDDAFLAIDQGPIIVMIENYRSGLLWNLFMNAPEVQTGLKKLGFTF